MVFVLYAVATGLGRRLLGWGIIAAFEHVDCGEIVISHVGDERFVERRDCFSHLID